MPNTYTQIHLHVVFAVKYRSVCIPPLHAERLYRYITGIVTEREQKLLAVNGMPDHVHLLVGLRPDRAPSDLVRDVKAVSSKFINEQNWLPGKFAWQEGFGAFSYSTSQLPAVIEYIERQQEHHAKRSFHEEYRLLLEKFQVSYEDKYLFNELEGEAN